MIKVNGVLHRRLDDIRAASCQNKHSDLWPFEDSDNHGQLLNISYSHEKNMPCHEKTVFFAYAKIKTQISCTVTAQLISAFFFAVRIARSLYYLNPKFQASSHLLWLYRPVCVGTGRKPQRQVFSQRGSNGTRYLG